MPDENSGAATGAATDSAGANTQTGGANTQATTNQGAATVQTGTSTATGNNAETTQTATPQSEVGNWPQNWRELASKGDEKLSARFGRYASPEAALTALIAAQNKISSGELKPVLGKNASVEEVAAFRKSVGIPETPDKYDLNFGVPIKEEDKNLVAGFLKAAHETNQTPEQVKASLKSFYAMTQMETEKRVERDAQFQKESEDSLRAEWGGEYRRNINLVHGLLDRVFDNQESKDKLLTGRLADGTPIGSDPATLKALVSLALIDNPTGTVVPGGSANQMAGLEEEIGKIEKTMRDNRSAYNKDEKMQARYRELLGAKEVMDKRKKAA